SIRVQQRITLGPGKLLDLLAAHRSRRAFLSVLCSHFEDRIVGDRCVFEAFREELAEIEKSRENRLAAVERTKNPPVPVSPAIDRDHDVYFRMLRDMVTAAAEDVNVVISHFLARCALFVSGSILPGSASGEDGKQRYSTRGDVDKAIRRALHAGAAAVNAADGYMAEAMASARDCHQAFATLKNAALRNAVVTDGKLEARTGPEIQRIQDGFREVMDLLYKLNASDCDSLMFQRSSHPRFFASCYRAGCRERKLRYYGGPDTPVRDVLRPSREVRGEDCEGKVKRIVLLFLREHVEWETWTCARTVSTIITVIELVHEHLRDMWGNLSIYLRPIGLQAPASVHTFITFAFLDTAVLFSAVTTQLSNEVPTEALEPGNVVICNVADDFLAECLNKVADKTGHVGVNKRNASSLSCGVRNGLLVLLADYAPWAQSIRRIGDLFEQSGSQLQRLCNGLACKWQRRAGGCDSRTVHTQSPSVSMLEYSGADVDVGSDIVTAVKFLLMSAPT
ncbi:MAG: hypothetical protein BJ554DRAFT_5311, partial [Olpidium bornovanus]